MKRAAITLLLLLCWCGGAVAQDPQPQPQPGPPPDVTRALAAVPYLSSTVPEQRVKAEKIVQAAAPMCFDKLVEQLPAQPRQGRESLLRILANTTHGGRVELCINTLCQLDSRRAERVIAAAALGSVDIGRLLDLLIVRLNQPALDPFARAQCQHLVGYVPAARAQALLEDLLDKATPGGLEASRLEVALLRSILAASNAEPAWSRWQKRRPDAPRGNLRDLQEALRGLARPTSVERLDAEARVNALVMGDRWLLLALGASNLPERAAYGLAALKRSIPDDMQLAALSAMLDMVATAGQESALMAIDVAVACAPPATDDLLQLRPVTSQDSISRLEAILEGLRRGGNLSDLRKQHARVSAQLRPLLLRRGALDAETRALMRQLDSVRNQLDYVERQWRQGWRREFESDVLGTRQAP